MNRPLISLTFLFILTLLVSACSGSKKVSTSTSNSNSTSSSNSVDMKLYQSDTWKYQLNYPNAWSTNDLESGIEFITNTAPFSPSVSIFSEENGDRSLDKFVSENKEEAKNIGVPIEFTKEESIKVGGEDAQFLIYEMTAPDFTMVLLQAVVIDTKNNIGHIFTSICKKEDLDTQSEAFENLLKSVRFQ